MYFYNDFVTLLWEGGQGNFRAAHNGTIDGNARKNPAKNSILEFFFKGVYFHLENLENWKFFFLIFYLNLYNSYIPMFSL